ncbi:hypothetical protein J1605_006520 [Eschrichtius robustus]|uniref:Uncharacterized protein n=1 Tax=Eschrichtius robustus TaxID=9764 RepID=A0AB34H3F5_ESCRO|nr:hypothetical protein J1605_006520 [Eschrichtius robustus]
MCSCDVPEPEPNPGPAPRPTAYLASVRPERATATAAPRRSYGQHCAQDPARHPAVQACDHIPIRSPSEPTVSPVFSPPELAGSKNSEGAVCFDGEVATVIYTCGHACLCHGCISRGRPGLLPHLPAARQGRH